jgi:hypothetical protein
MISTALTALWLLLDPVFSGGLAEVFAASYYVAPTDLPAPAAVVPDQDASVGACIGALAGGARQGCSASGVGALAGGALSGCGAPGGICPPSAPIGGSGPCPSCTADANKAGSKLAAELVAILNETESVDTFLLTMSCLEAARPNAELVVPALIRNADRLGITKGISSGKNRTEQQEALLNTLEQLLKEHEEPEPTRAGKYVAPPAAACPRPCISYYGPSPAQDNPRCGPARTRRWLAILNETSSRQTLLQAAEALAALPCEGDKAELAVLRNADRLGLLQEFFRPGPRTPEQERLGACLRRLARRHASETPGAVRSASFE